MLTSEMRTALEALGADIPVALGRLNNNEKLYVRLLGMFSSSNAADPAAYRACIETANAEEILRLVHDLKSSAGNLGLMPLHDAAAKLELDIKTKKVLDKTSGDALVADLEVVLNALNVSLS